MDVRLVQISDYGLQEYPVEEMEFVIGREPSCHLRPDHGRVGQRHCRLYWYGNRLLADDLNSATGTFVNDERINLAPIELRDGDELRVGPVRFLVRLSPDPAASSRPTADWVASVQEARNRAKGGPSPSDSNIISPLAQTARRILDRIAHDHEGAIDSGSGSHKPEAPSKRHGLLVSEDEGVALAKILDRSVIDEVEIGRIAQELEALIESGQSRIALHFGNVEHLSSQALSTVLRAHGRCRSEGGMLKICTLQPAVAELFKMTNVLQQIEVYPDEAPALRSPWPQPLEKAPPIPEPARPSPPAAATTPKPPASAKQVARGASRVRLLVDVGRASGKTIEVSGPRFVIGRDRRCQLRPNSDTISRVHAIIEQRDGRVFVRDYGTKNGTILNGRTLHGEEAEAADGDRLQVGVLQFTFQVEPCSGQPPATVEDEMAAWLLGQDSTDSESPTALMIPTMPYLEPDPEGTEAGPPEPVAPAPAPTRAAAGLPPLPDLLAEPLPHGEMHFEVIHGVLVIKVPQGELDDEATVGPFRHNLLTLLDHPLPRKVVLDLENIHYLSSRAVGVILAYFQRLDRDGGSLRVCCVSPQILPVLDQMRLPHLIDLYPSIEEAVSDPWI